MSDYRPYETINDLPHTVPLFPVGGALLLPRGRLPLNVFEPRYMTMVDDALAGSRLIGMIQPREEGSRAERPALYARGCVGRLTSFSETPDGHYMITLTGITRFEMLEEMGAITPYRQARVSYTNFAPDLTTAADEGLVPREQLLSVLRHYLDKFGMDADWQTIESAPAETLVNSLSMICPFEWDEKQALLEADSLKGRSDALIALLEMAAAEYDDDEFPIQ